MSNNEEENFDLFLDKIKNEYKDGWTEENWEEEMEKHPFFMTKAPGESEDVSAEVEAIRQLKWDPEDTPREKAVKYKDEGNVYFRAKNYKKAAISYSMALKEEISDDKEFLSILHSNRAAAEFHLQNYRSCLRDCVFARKFNKSNYKAIVRGAECCLAIKMFSDAIEWCDAAISINPNDAKPKELRKKVEVEKKIFERDQRKKEASERKKTEKQIKLLKMIKEKGISVEEKDDEFVEMMENPQSSEQKMVELNEEQNGLVWPVFFLYPEFGQTDFIKRFDETSTFQDHLDVMFSESPPWDEAHKYKSNNLQVYYENRVKGRLTKISSGTSLLKALQKEGCVVQLGTPKFILLIKNSEFEKIYIEKYNEFN